MRQYHAESWYINHFTKLRFFISPLGGVSGAVSKITGTVGKGLAALTLDDEFQQKRRQAMSQRPTNLKQGLAKGVKGLGKVDLS